VQKLPTASKMHLKTKIRYGSYIFFAIISIIFSITYGTISLEQCYQTLISSSTYSANASCGCLNNPGANSAFFNKLVETSDFNKQFSVIPGASYNSKGAITINSSLTIYSNSICLYGISYFNTEFTQNLLHSKQLEIFSDYDPLALNVSTFNTAPFPCFTLPQYSFCQISYAGIGVYSLNSTSECNNFMNNIFNGSFDSSVGLGWDENNFYPTICQLDSCMIPANYCPTLDTFNIFSFCAGVISFTFGLIRVFRWVLCYFLFRKERSIVHSV
jgi:hypothetical protein